MPRLKVNSKLEPFFKPKPIKVAIGGRGSGKSIGVGDILTFKMATEGADVYCLREFQDSITDSVHRVFEDSIEKRLQLDGWTIQANAVIAPNGAKTVYKGANRNPDAMQSAQGFKYSWFEEAHRASQASIDKLLPTILRNPGAECWFTANPQASGDPFSQRFIVPYLQELEKSGYYEDDLHLIVVVNWRDNPWWNEEQEALRAWDFKHLSRAKYDWIWEGKFMDTVDDAIIDPAWFDACIDAHERLGFKPEGIEVVSHDPADSGDDKARARRRGVVILDVDTKSAGDVNESLDWATDFANEYQADAFIWDVGGMGLGLKRQVSQAFEGKKINAEMFDGAATADSPDRVYDPVDEVHGKPKTNREYFVNKRAQYYWLLRDRMYKTWMAVEKGKFINPEELVSFSSEIKELQALRSELCRIPRKNMGSGKIQLVSKPDMKKKPYEMASPNRADAVVMLFAAQGYKKRDKAGKKYMNLGTVA